MWSLVVVLMLISVLPIHTQLVTNSNGTSGDPCPEKRCLATRAECINDQCVCNAPFVLFPNNGHFACYRSNQVFAEVKNDPTIRNFNNEVVNFPYPCRYLVTSVTTDLRINKVTQGSCTCQLHAWNSKFRGKFFVEGYDLGCFINNTLLGETLGFSVRQEGIAQNGQYTYQESSANTYVPDGPWPISGLNFSGAGVNVVSSYDLVNNQARVAILECGIIVTLVAYDLLESRDQDQIPGLSVAVNCGLGPVFNDNDRVMATAPPRFGGSLYSSLQDPPLSLQEVLLIRAFNSQVLQNQPNAAATCSTLGGVLNQCNRANLLLAVAECFWMLDEARFIRCMNPDRNSNPVLSLLQSCVQSRCTGSPSCPEFVSLVTDGTNCGTVPRIPQLARIVDGSFCPP